MTLHRVRRCRTNDCRRDDVNVDGHDGVGATGVLVQFVRAPATVQKPKGELTQYLR